MLKKSYRHEVFAQIKQQGLLRAGKATNRLWMVALFVFWVSVARSMMQ